MLAALQRNISRGLRGKNADKDRTSKNELSWAHLSCAFTIRVYPRKSAAKSSPDRVKKQRISRQRLAAILRPKAKKNYSPFA